MSNLTIKNGDNSFSVEGQEIIDLELKLNITNYGHTWKDIGDHLFNFHNLQNYANQPSDILYTNNTQFQFLKYLKERTYDEIRKEYSKE